MRTVESLRRRRHHRPVNPPQPAIPPEPNEPSVPRALFMQLLEQQNRLLAALPAHDAFIAQQGADSAVKQLAEQGLLRQKPARTGVVKHVVRDDRGQITSMVDMVEQIEESPDDVA